MVNVDSIAHAGVLLGLVPEPGRPAAGPAALEVEDVVFDDPACRLVLASPAGRVEVIVQPIESASGFYRRTRHLALSHAGERAPAAILALIDRLAVRLADATPAALLEALALKPEATRAPDRGTGDTGLDVPPCDAAPAQAGKGCAPDSAGIHRTWDDPAAWMRFFADDESSQDATEAIEPDPAAVAIQHGPHDCMFLCPRELVRRPWQDRRQERSPRRFLVTAVDDSVAIAGGERVLRAAVDAARTLSPSLLLVHAGCVPQLAGDDAAGVVEDARHGGGGCQVVYSGSKSEPDPTRYWLALLGHPGEGAAEAARLPRSYNLLGFRRGPDRDELVAALGRHGLSLNEAMLPAATAGSRSRLPRAAATVVLPCRTWDAPYRELLAGAGGVAIRPPAPFGLTATTAFLSTVAEGLGDPAAAAALRSECDSQAGRFGAIAREASTEAVGFAVGPHEVGRLADGARTHGVPLVAAVEDLGFKVFVAVLGGEPSEADLPWLGGRAGWTTARSLADLLGWWRRNDVGAAYSEFGSDSRLADAGITPFDAGVFEMGLDGALRTARRILARCRLPLCRVHLSRACA
ncbi:MAG: hypothetical protein FJ087_18640 [Deltaproteobacteria bacterium]|nr:hypothetical protein [Deltaproteobacteria bacterium]